MPEHFTDDQRNTLWHGGVSLEEAMKDANEYREVYIRDTQRALTRTNTHFHRRGKDGKDVPLAACRSKRDKGKCKHGHPKTKQITARAKIVCKGVAKQHGLRTSGQRNALGNVLGKRK